MYRKLTIALLALTLTGSKFSQADQRSASEGEQVIRSPVEAVRSPSAEQFKQPLTSAVPMPINDKLAQIIDIADFGVKCDFTDQRERMQAAIDAAPAGAVLRNSCAGLVGIGAHPSKSYGLRFDKPIRLECTRGGGYLPMPSLGNMISVLYFYGSEYSYLQTSIDGCFIGNFGSDTRYGLHAIVFDTQAENKQFFHPAVRNSYVQGNKNQPDGYGIFAINNPRNFVGGVHNTTLCENSVIYGGYSLNDVGDSIIIRNCTNIGLGRIYVNLIHTKTGGTAGNFVIDGGPITNAAGLVIDCAASAQIINIVAEQIEKANTPDQALIDVRGEQCQVQNVSITYSQIQANFGTNLSTLIRIGNAANTVLDNLRIATPTPFPPIIFSKRSINGVFGAGNAVYGGGTISDLGVGTKRTVVLPFNTGPVTVGGPDSCGVGFRCLRSPN